MKLNLMSYAELRTRLQLSVGVTKEAIARELDRRDRSIMHVSGIDSTRLVSSVRNKSYYQPLISYL